jgi:quercetin dioxygenase-like cupin family protein
MKTQAGMFCAAFGALALALTGSQALADTQPVVKFPNDITFGTAPEGRPRIAVLEGDPSKPGFYILRMKFPAGTKIVPHTHPEEIRTLTVISGTLYFGFGETFDEAKAKPFPPGTYFTETPTSPHFVWAKDGDVIVQVSGVGPTGFNPVK